MNPGFIALAALVYPAALRSIGIGWAMGTGRAGQVFLALGLAPLLGVMARGWHTSRLPATEVGVTPGGIGRRRPRTD